MLFDKNDGMANDRIIFSTKPNMLLGCKKAIFGVIVLIIILMLSPLVVKFVGHMQVYLISYIQLSLTRYTAIAIFVIILITIVYIIWQLIGWYSLEYTLTESRIIIKSGVLSTKKNYMPYAVIQDINTSQSILAKMVNVGSVSVFSAYDNNQLELKDISNPSEVEEIIFSKMVGPKSFQQQPQRVPQRSNNYENKGYNNYLGRNEVYDEYEPITPITHERNQYQRGNYDYSPNEGNYYPRNDANPHHTYEYESYNGVFNDNNQPRNDYYEEPAEYIPQDHYEEDVKYSNEDTDKQDSSEAIQRHFDKFRK